MAKKDHILGYDTAYTKTVRGFKPSNSTFHDYDAAYARRVWGFKKIDKSSELMMSIVVSHNIDKLKNLPSEIKKSIIKKCIKNKSEDYVGLDYLHLYAPHRNQQPTNQDNIAESSKRNSNQENYFVESSKRNSNQENYVGESSKLNSNQEIYDFESSKQNCIQENYIAESSKQNSIQEIYVDESSKQNSNRENYVGESSKQNSIQENYVVESSKWNFNRENYVSESSKQNSIQENYVAEFSNQNSIQENYVGESSKQNYNRENYVDESSKQNYIQENYVGKSCKQNSIQENYVGESCKQNSIQENYVAESSKQNFIQENYVGESSKPSSIQENHAVEQYTERALRKKPRVQYINSEEEEEYTIWTPSKKKWKKREKERESLVIATSVPEVKPELPEKIKGKIENHNGSNMKWPRVKYVDSEEEEEYKIPTPPKQKREKERRKAIIQTPVVPAVEPELPEEIREKIREMNGSDIKWLITKRLFNSDVSPTHTRFSMPMNQIDISFLRDDEKKILNKREGIETGMVGPTGERTNKVLKKWVMEKPNGKVIITYNVINGWYKDVVVKDGLKRDQLVHVWSFREGSNLFFALVKVDE